MNHKITVVENPITLNGQPLELSSKRLELFLLLLRHKGRIVSKKLIFDILYPTRPTYQAQNLIKVMVCHIRKKLDEVSPGSSKIIQTIHGKGYSLVDTDVKVVKKRGF